MSDSKEYILKPFTVLSKEKPGTEHNMEDCYRIEYANHLHDSLWATGYIELCEVGDFEQLFIEFDREQLEQQLEEQFQRVFEGFVTNKIISQDDLDLCKRDLAEDVLALFLGEEANK